VSPSSARDRLSLSPIKTFAKGAERQATPRADASSPRENPASEGSNDSCCCSRAGSREPSSLGGARMDVGLRLGNAWGRQRFWLLASCVRLTQPILNCVILWAVVPRP
jgi:hypothetical protein